jgi:hypothetical protein
MSASDDEDLVLVAIPPLVALLVHHEQEKGEPLTEAEVLAIRDKAVCMAMPTEVARKLAESRGYDDLDPENIWVEWQEFRETE